MDEATVLIVDDEVNILNALKRAVRREPYQVLTASSGMEGLKLLQEQRVDLIISDQRMPEMTGVQFLAKVKELCPDTIRIILSGYTDVNSITEAINVGNVYKFMLKPWEDDALKVTIRESLEMAKLLRENKKLADTITDQNEELRYLNKNLEREVENRTAEIQWQNEALKLVRDLIESLPIAVIGTDEEGNIVFVNGLARDYFEKNGSLILATHLKDHFGQNLVDTVGMAIETNEQQDWQYRHDGGTGFHVSCVPLSKRIFEVPRRGSVLSFLKINGEDCAVISHMEKSDG
ncbi:MAG: response regulator [Pseudomonadota bacterium]